MKNIFIITFFNLVVIFNANSQSFISDSIIYRYVGNLSEDDGKILLRQFGLKDQITNRTEIIRDGDLIAIRTQLEQKWRIKIVGITIQNRTDLKKTLLNDGRSILQQTFFGVSDMFVYHTDTEALIPIQSMDSPSVTVIWQLLDLNRDGSSKQLIFNLITSRDICEIIYCHPK